MARASVAVSVVIPTHNRAHLVGRAVASALAAIAPGDEIIVVDDGSTDATEAALAPFRDRIRYERRDHRGAGAARNHGVRVARAPLVAFLDSDDEWMPDKLVLQRAVMASRPDVLSCFSDFAAREADGREHRCYLAQWHRDARGWDEILGPAVPFSSLAPLPPGRGEVAVHVGNMYRAMMRACYMSTITVMARRDAGEALRFAEDLPLYEDWECFARLARAGHVAYLACETAWNHGHRGPRLISADALVAAQARITLLKRLWGSEPAFLLAAGGEYHRILIEQHLLRARALLMRGHTGPAREALRLAGGGPLAYRAMAALPGAVARGLVAAGRTLLGR